ncbi:DUF3426 domain-containing protein [Azospira restricta]|uniref:Zinc-ribbon domain-containing protein n=1 Tax=Azospira restricta TaxID=404405 RepID=A0A974Y3S1_9RHOO|nr:DUF3426 domain-containing protein [Azospira restricta]QRJ64040.1 zinc-ribbon domain-containing protein [Azospira restricta]
MLTCCPACGTNFRVTPEQLKARAGKVRCGKCQTVFNALDTLLEATPPATETAPASAAESLPPPPAAPAAAPVPPVADFAPAAIAEADKDEETEHISDVPADIAQASPGIEPEPAARKAEPAGEHAIESAPDEAAEAPPLSPEAVRDTALAAGLVAARETTELPGYNKWAEGAFTGTTSLAEPTARPLWPFVLAALLLLVALAGQVGHHFRAEIAVASPALRPLLEAGCAALGCDIPLPRHSELVSIESSDLQIDPAQGGALALSATLKNRAAYAQAWPLLEVTLTDVQDNAVVRRVLQPADYLPPKLDPTVFPPNGEVGVRLWLEAKDVVAAGYRLYVFYP